MGPRFGFGKRFDFEAACYRPQPALNRRRYFGAPVDPGKRPPGGQLGRLGLRRLARGELARRRWNAAGKLIALEAGIQLIVAFLVGSDFQFTAI